MNKTIDQLLEEYKDSALGFYQPIMRELFNLAQAYPNDADLGKNVRDLLLRAEEHRREKAKIGNEETLQKILDLQKYDEQRNN